MEPKKHYFAKIPTIAIFIVMAMSGPLGVLLFILKGIDQKVQKEEQAAANANAPYSTDFRTQDTHPETAASVQPDPEYIYGHDTPTKEQRDSKERHKLLTFLCTLFGVIFLLSGFGKITDFVDMWAYYKEWSQLLVGLAQMVGGGGALFTGLRMDRTRKLEKQLDRIVGDRDNISLEELFAAAGVDAAQGQAAVKRAIDHGYFGADAYLDNRTGTLVVRGAAPQPPKPQAAPAPQPSAAPEDEYSALLRQLRTVNDAIPDPVMSQKITRLENISGRIFALAEKDPDKKAQLRKFMDYYLPTALRLLNTYASLSAQQVEGANITEAKQSIEGSMDLLVTAFENQLDKLFQADALDVSADIAALEGMLNLDGLTGSSFSH